MNFHWIIRVFVNSCSFCNIFLNPVIFCLCEFSLNLDNFCQFVSLFLWNFVKFYYVCFCDFLWDSFCHRFRGYLGINLVYALASGGSMEHEDLALFLSKSCTSLKIYKLDKNAWNFFFEPSKSLHGCKIDKLVPYFISSSISS